MHVMGKVGVWLVVIAAAASTVLTAKLIQVRNSWTKKYAGYQAAYQKLQPQIASLSEQVARLEGDYFRSKELWGDMHTAQGQYMNDVATTVQRPAEGVLQIDRGLNHGLREKMTLYGFEILPDGSSIYRGDFTIVTARDVLAQLQPNWRVRSEDVQTWQPNAKWRWRNQIPPGIQSTYDGQIGEIARSDDSLADRKVKLATQVALEKKNQAQLDLRIAELVGGDQLSKDPAVDVEYREGLVAAIEQTEEARNQVLRKVDELRHRLRMVQEGVDRQKTENIEASRKLPQPPTAVGSKD